MCVCECVCLCVCVVTLKVYKVFFLFHYRNTGNQQLTPLLSIIAKSSLTITPELITFRPLKWQYVPLKSELEYIDRLTVKLGNENGETISISKEGYGETRISMHICSEKFLKSG